MTTFKHELLPCPFCGGRADVHQQFGRLIAGCVNRDCAIRPDTWGKCETTDLRKVAKVWNMRPKAAAQ